MARAVLLVVAVFFVLLAWRALRLAIAAFFRPASPARRPPPVEGELIRDPICGAWVDRRVALSGVRGGKTVSVCSDRCRALLEKE